MDIHSDADEGETIDTPPSDDKSPMSCVWVFTDPVVGRRFLALWTVVFHWPWVGCVSNGCVLSRTS